MISMFQDHDHGDAGGFFYIGLVAGGFVEADGRDGFVCLASSTSRSSW